MAGPRSPRAGGGRASPAGASPRGASPTAAGGAGSAFFSRAFSRRQQQPKAAAAAGLEQQHHAALLQFKARIARAGLGLPPALLVNNDLDALLVRFLRARRWHIEHAFAMLEKSLQWRARVGADTCLEHPVEARLVDVVRACRPSSYIGFDARHHPIFVERLGKLDGRTMEAQGASDDVIVAYHLREMEFMTQVMFAEASAAAGHTVDRVVSIMDAQGLTLSQLTGFAQRLFRLITTMDSDNYPEACEAIFIVNAGAAFSAVWRLVSSFVDKGTRDKVTVLSGGKPMQTKLFEVFGADLVPEFLGGALDYDATRAHWLRRMDEALAARAAAPRGALPLIRLEVPPEVLAAEQQQQHHHHHHHYLGRGSSGGGAAGVAGPSAPSLTSSISSWMHRTSLTRRDSAGGGGAAAASSSSNAAAAAAAAPAAAPTQQQLLHQHLHPHLHHGSNPRTASAGGSSDDDGWATPRSAASRMSSASGATVFFDAAERPSFSGGGGGGGGDEAAQSGGGGALGASGDNGGSSKRPQPACGCGCVIS